MKRQLQHIGWSCNRCGKTTRRGNWRREGEEAVFYCQPCVIDLGGPTYNPSVPIPSSARRALVVISRQQQRLIRFPRWMSRKQQHTL